MAHNCENVECQVLNSVESFTLDFHKNVVNSLDGNYVSSPLSAHTVLSMATYGAEGSTANEMRKVLHLPEDDTLAHQEFQNLIKNLNSVTKVTLKVANKIYIANNLTITNKFKEITSKHFHSEIDKLDFNKRVESVKLVNQWCIDNTNGKIKEIITEGDVNASVRMILLNAVYFKGSWKHKFLESNTTMKPFHIDKNTSINVSTMYIKKKFFYTELDAINAQCVALPYENEDMFMVLIVPKEIDGLNNIEQNLDKIELNYKDFKQYSTEIELFLPKFKVETTINLKSHLNQLGMVEMFSDCANFKGISNEALKVDKVIQKAFIEVNEEGCEAAAVTGMTAVLLSMPLPPIPVRIDRPFLYQIVHSKFETVLFSGHITELTIAKSSKS